jgi:hypothetical protein
MKITQMTNEPKETVLKVGDLVSGKDGQYLVVELSNNKGYGLLTLGTCLIIEIKDTLQKLTCEALAETDAIIPNDKLELIIHN